MLPSVTDKANHGVKLGRWIAQLHSYRKSGICSAYLTDERIKLLDEIGMVWLYGDKWEKGFGYAETYFKQHGDLLVKNDYVTEDGYALGKWIVNQRSAYKGTARSRLTDEQKKRLDDIGFVVDVNEYRWNCASERAAEYYRYHGTVSVPCGYKVDGIDLQSWFTEQRRTIKNGKLNSTQVMKLSQLGICV